MVCFGALIQHLPLKLELSLTRTHDNCLSLSLLSTLLGELRPVVGALVDGESNGNLQTNESKSANVADSGNRHTVCRQRAYLFTIDTDCSAPARTD